MTWNQSLNVNSWYSFVIILLLRCLIVYGWQGAPCKVIRQFSRTQLPVNCGWGAESTLHCQGQPICTKNIVFSERGTPVPSAQARMRYRNNRRGDDVVVSAASLCQRVKFCTLSSSWRTLVSSISRKRHHSSNTHAPIFMGENCLKHWYDIVKEHRIHRSHLLEKNF